jgi:alpha-galactosidase
MGWSSWDALAAGADHPVRDFCDTVSVKAAADAYIETGLYAAGYRHLHLDDCWAATERNASGYIQPDPVRFPGGMKEVADYPRVRAFKGVGVRAVHFGGQDGLRG